MAEETQRPLLQQPDGDTGQVNFRGGIRGQRGSLCQRGSYWEQLWPECLQGGQSHREKKRKEENVIRCLDEQYSQSDCKNDPSVLTSTICRITFRISRVHSLSPWMQHTLQLTSLSILLLLQGQNSYKQNPIESVIQCLPLFLSSQRTFFLQPNFREHQSRPGPCLPLVCLSAISCQCLLCSKFWDVYLSEQGQKGFILKLAQETFNFLNTKQNAP